MFRKAAQIAATPALNIVSMERREAVAAKRYTLEGEPAILIGMDAVKPALLNPATGLTQPVTWERLERQTDFYILHGWRTTSYFGEVTE